MIPMRADPGLHDLETGQPVVQAPAEPAPPAKPQCSPRPWRVAPNLPQAVLDARGRHRTLVEMAPSPTTLEALQEAEADAREIVRCVNGYPYLLAGIEQALEIVASGPSLQCSPLVPVLRSALRNGGGGDRA